MRRTLKSSILMFLAVLAPVTAGALTLDVESAVRLALEYNLDLESTRIDLRTTARARKNAWNEFLPSVTTTASLGRSNEAPTVAGVELSPWTVNFTAKASLSLTSATVHSIRAAVLDYEAGLITYETAKKKLERDVRKAFYSLILARESINLAEMELATAVRNYEQTLKNYNAGLVPRLQVLSAQVAAENLRPALESKKLFYTAGLMSFKMLLGLESEEEIILEGSIETEVYHFDGPELAVRFVNGRLNIQALSKNIEALENAKKIQELSGLSPTLSLAVS